MRDLTQRRRVETVEFVPALASRDDKAGLFEDVEVLGDRLSGRTKPVLCREANTELEEGLAGPFLELVQDRSSGWVGEGLEHVTRHGVSIGKSVPQLSPDYRTPLACSQRDRLAGGQP